MSAPATSGFALPRLWSSGRFLPRFGLFGLVWFLLTGADAASWVVGGPVILLAVAVSLALAGPASDSPALSGLFPFGLFFLRQSLLSGIDVMRRALSPGLLLNPGLVTYDSFLPPGPALVLFVNTISLLPGTLSVDLDDHTVLVHALDVELPVWASLQNLEGRIAALFRLHPGRC